MAAEVLSIDSIICNLHKCRALKNLVYAQHLHAFACNNGLESHSAIGNHLVPLFVECGSVFDAQKVFHRLNNQNEHSWTSIISGHVLFGQPHSALKVYQQMQELGIDSSSYTLVTLLKAFWQLKDVNGGRDIHCQIAQRGYDKEFTVGSTLVNLYAKCGSLSEAQDVFNRFSAHPLTSWNSLIYGYSEHGHDKGALNSLEIMQKNEIAPNAFTYACVLKACTNLGSICNGQTIHKDIIEKGFESDLSVGNTLIGMYSKTGLTSEAMYLFDTMLVRDVITWTATVAGCAENGFCEEALVQYELMQFEGVHPNNVTLICCLKACLNNNTIDKGKELYFHLVCIGLEVETHVGNSLLAMYAKWGWWLDAKYVFGKLCVKDIVSWTSLTVGYAEHGCFHEVLKCYQEMEFLGTYIDASMSACILKACASLKELSNGEIIHRSIMFKGIENELSVGNSLISMYAKSGSLLEAEQVLQNMKTRDIVSWTSIVAGYAEHGPAVDVMRCLELMRLEGITTSPNLYACALKACMSIAAINVGHELHAGILASGYENHAQIGISLMDFYAKSALIPEAQQVFDNSPVKDSVSWTTLIAGYAEFGLHEEVIKWFTQMQADGISADAFTLAAVSKACGDQGILERCQELHSMIIEDGFETDQSVASSMISMYNQCGFPSKAKEVFDLLPVQELVSWSALISGYADAGHGQEALDCVARMLRNGESADVVTLSCCLKACSSMSATEEGHKIHMQVVKKGFEADIPVSNNLISLYFEGGLDTDARKVFDKMPTRNVVAWTSMISRFAEYGTGQEALDLYEKMRLENILPHIDTFCCVLKACGCVGAIHIGQEAHEEVLQRGMDGDQTVGNSLINMYAKCGSTEDARAVFARLPDHDVVAWSSIIGAYGLNHQGKMAIQCFEAMQESDVKPDAVTFTCLLNACRHGSLANEGKGYFKGMQDVFGIVQTEEHYTCVVDFLARSGQLHEAERLLSLLPPSERTWATLLNACKTYGDPELGSRCFEQLIQMKPDEGAWYVLMAEIYSNSGRLEDAFRVEELRKRRGVKKKPAVALIEVGKKVHEFTVGGTMEDPEVSELMDFLSFRLKHQGHVPNLDTVPKPLSDERKGSLLCLHAEKLAIAFGLLNTPQGQTIRVTKNLRMCSNCHEATKIISKMEKREIILRDNCCIHRFRDGSCSCSDMF